MIRQHKIENITKKDKTKGSRVPFKTHIGRYKSLANNMDGVAIKRSDFWVLKHKIFAIKNNFSHYVLKKLR